MESESAAVQETAAEFTRELDTVKGRLLRLADEAGEGLDNTLRRLERNSRLVTIALFGQTRTGKSTTLEALTGGDGTTIGIGRQHTTTQITEYFWPPQQKTLRIVDTPGIEGFNGEELAALAVDFVEIADHIFFLISDDKIRAGELEHFANIRNMGKGITVLLNVKRNDEDLIADLEDPEFSFDDLLDDLFEEGKIAGHKQRIREYLARNPDISIPTVLPVHARAAWLATQPEHKNHAQRLRELSRIASVERRIREFIDEEALAARIESPGQAIRSHVVSIQDELRAIAGQFRDNKAQTDKQLKALGNSVRRASREARKELSGMKKAFQDADERIPGLVDTLVAERGGGEKLRSEWKEMLKSSGVEDSPQNFRTDARGLFEKELNEQFRLLEDQPGQNTNPGGSDLGGAESKFAEIDDNRQYEAYRRIGRAGIRIAGTLVSYALTAWTLANFWNPSGWVAGAAASIGRIGGDVAGEQTFGAIADAWRDANRKQIRKRQDAIVRELRTELWRDYRKTDIKCSDWLNRYKEALLREILGPLVQVSSAQEQLRWIAVVYLRKFDELLESLDLDVVAKLAELAVPAIKEGIIEVTRVARWEGQCTKILVAAVRPVDDVLRRCNGRADKRKQRLTNLLNGDHVAWVESNLDFRTQIQQGLRPARINALDVGIVGKDQPIDVTVASDQMGLANGKRGANVRMVERLLQVRRINIRES